MTTIKIEKASSKRAANRVTAVALLASLLVAIGLTAHAAESATVFMYHRFGEQNHPATNVRIDQPDKDDPLNPSKSVPFFAGEYEQVMDYSEMFRKGAVKKRTKDLTILELVKAIRNVKEAFPHVKDEHIERERMAMVV